MLQQPPQQKTHLRKLGEDQAAVAFRPQFADHLDEARRLVGFGGGRHGGPRLLDVKRGVVANLLQTGERRENGAAAGQAGAAVNAPQEVVQDAFVQGGLLLVSGTYTFDSTLSGRSGTISGSDFMRRSMNGRIKRRS